MWLLAVLMIFDWLSRCVLEMQLMVVQYFGEQTGKVELTSNLSIYHKLKVIIEVGFCRGAAKLRLTY